MQVLQSMNVHLDWTAVMSMLYAMTQKITTLAHVALDLLVMDSTAPVCSYCMYIVTVVNSVK